MRPRREKPQEMVSLWSRGYWYTPETSWRMVEATEKGENLMDMDEGSDFYHRGWSTGYDEGYEQAKIQFDRGSSAIILYTVLAAVGFIWGMFFAIVIFNLI